MTTPSAAGIEIERKFLLATDAWRVAVAGTARIEQAYLAATRDVQVRVRRYGSDGFVAVKGPRSGRARIEIETAVPVSFVDAVIASGLCLLAPIIKDRHLVPVEDVTFEIDEYRGDNEGLVVAEVELPTADAAFPRPAWLGAEISDDARYRNLNLARFPYRQWRDS